MKARSILIFMFLIMGSFFMMTEKAFADSLDELRSLLPVSIGEWKAEGEDQFYDPRTIFDYIDGAGEVYRAYSMRRCLSRRYAGPKGGVLILDIFDMGSSEDAYGVFTHDREGNAVPLGQEGLYNASWLRFWKDRFFISLSDETRTDSSEEMKGILARKVSELIREPGRQPALISRLPFQGLETGSLRYLHDPVILNTHFYLSDENILHLGSGTEAALATYEHMGARLTLLLVQYPDEDKAALAHGSLMKHYLPNADREGIARLEDGKWAGSGRRGRFLAAVLESSDRETAVRLMAEALESAEKQ